MTASTEVERLTVRSPDGVDLAVWVEGHGPPLVLVHGSIQDHTISAALVAELTAEFTTYAMDRRGFGASGDAPAYSLGREFADVVAVVDAVTARTGDPVVLWGHSFGASCAMGAAALTGNVSHVVLYEPSLGLPYPAGWIDRVEQVVAGGDHETAIVMVLRDLLELTDEQIAERRAEPEWPGRVATAPTVVREARAEQEWTYAGGSMDRISAPTLLLSGTESPPDIVRTTAAARAAIPGARVRRLPGQAHIAHRTDPAMVARIVSEFVRE
ncbi:alpha/beta fold hydrolase [Nocardioides sp. NPDC058538]|uniref:alpha/beta fold hydrolase n=1 Tax=Nocardioides sp. NPDC058538 TaxID=3346542 RepID=UPI0036560EA2